MMSFTDIRTPEEYPWGYSLDWRHSVAISGESRYARDEWVTKQAQFMRSQALALRPLVRLGNADQKSVEHANRIYTATQPDLLVARHKMEALLLCPELTQANIARAMDLPTRSVQAYERIFFNVRDAAGCVLSSPWLNEYFASKGFNPARGRTPEIHWKRIAFESGHKMLFSIWGWKIPGETTVGMPESEFYMSMFRELFSNLYDRVCNQGLDGRSSVDLLKELGARFADLRDRGILSEEEDISENAVLGRILHLMSPDMAELDSSRTNAIQLELESKIGSIKQTETSSTGNTLSKISMQLKG